MTFSVEFMKFLQQHDALSVTFQHDRFSNGIEIEMCERGTSEVAKEYISPRLLELSVDPDVMMIDTVILLQDTNFSE